MKIIGFDYPCMDMNILCAHMPGEEELVEMKDISLMGGGKVANAVITAARLGAKTAFLGAVGQDRYGKLCLKDMRRHGVDVGGVAVKEGKTALCISIVDEEKHGKHYIESKPTVERLAFADLSLNFLEHGDYLMLYQFDETAEALAAYAHSLGCFVVADGDEYDERTQKNMPNIDIFILSEYYYNCLFPTGSYEENIDRISKQGPGIVVVTLGGRGSMGIDHGKFFQTEAYPVNTVDTTGAGDVFHGAFTKALADGKSGREAALYAGAVSAVKCTVLGGRTGIPTEECVRHFMETGEILPCDFQERENRYRVDLWQEENG